MPDWRRSGRKAELAVRRELRARGRSVLPGPPHCEPQCGMFPPDPLPSNNTGGYKAVRRAHHAAGVSAYSEERGLCSAACVSWHGLQAKEERADDAGGRTSATAASYSASWL